MTKEIEQHIITLTASIQATGEELGLKGNHLQCYIKQQVRNVIKGIVEEGKL